MTYEHNVWSKIQELNKKIYETSRDTELGERKTKVKIIGYTKELLKCFDLVHQLEVAR